MIIYQCWNYRSEDILKLLIFNWIQHLNVQNLERTHSDNALEKELSEHKNILRKLNGNKHYG